MNWHHDKAVSSETLAVKFIVCFFTGVLSSMEALILGFVVSTFPFSDMFRNLLLFRLSDFAAVLYPVMLTLILYGAKQVRFA